MIQINFSKIKKFFFFLSGLPIILFIINLLNERKRRLKLEKSILEADLEEEKKRRSVEQKIKNNNQEIYHKYENIKNIIGDSWTN